MKTNKKILIITIIIAILLLLLWVIQARANPTSIQYQQCSIAQTSCRQDCLMITNQKNPNNLISQCNNRCYRWYIQCRGGK